MQITQMEAIAFLRDMIVIGVVAGLLAYGIMRMRDVRRWKRQRPKLARQPEKWEGRR